MQERCIIDGQEVICIVFPSYFIHTRQISHYPSIHFNQLSSVSCRILKKELVSPLVLVKLRELLVSSRSGFKLI